MPAKPVWYRKLPEIIQALEVHGHSYVDRATIELLLGIGRRRAQQIMAPCISDRVGSSGLADRDQLIGRLRELAAGEESYYELQRARKVARSIERLRREWLTSPQLLVEAPAVIIHQEFENLPPGVRLEEGRITVEFLDPQEGLQNLLALAMAIANDFAAFERITRKRDSTPS